MSQACDYISTGSCLKKKCEVNLFLDDFVKRRFKDNLRNIGFECLDISGVDGKKPEISFVTNGQKVIIEAKTLSNQDVNKIRAFTERFEELVNKFRSRNSQTFKKIIRKRRELENIGAILTFDETILSLSPILNKKDYTPEQEDIVSRLINSVYNKVNNLVKNHKESGSINVDISKFEKIKIKEQKNVKKNLYERASIINMEIDKIERNIYEVHDEKLELIEHLSIIEENIRKGERKLGVTIDIMYQPLGVENPKIGFKYNVLDSTFKGSTCHYVDMVKSAEAKFKEYGSDVMKILFFNNDFVKLSSIENDGYREIIEIIRSSVDNNIIDEIWMEYNKPSTEIDHINYITIEGPFKKEYELIYTNDNELS